MLNFLKKVWPIALFVIFVIGCIEEIAWDMGFINDEQLEKLANKYLKSGYGEYLLRVCRDSGRPW